ncbi:hypothetical protein J2128_002465 [Methanomicrobium sp. W14]|uniref:hypothetical protein n=1 Tax=Methanomicrobium sp. W14 TaxID=2817839 RepID=UPI001AE51BD2|nr:hypothetical protein [Methanomicrobium sp. W14]MBP2134499.1 hypothetical protein [Methanomicrobium sp. W14]
MPHRQEADVVNIPIRLRRPPIPGISSRKGIDVKFTARRKKTVYLAQTIRLMFANKTTGYNITTEFML